MQNGRVVYREVQVCSDAPPFRSLVALRRKAAHAAGAMGR
jgi:hypothetical protein